MTLPAGGANSVRVWSVVVAGGSGRRIGSLKQFEPLGPAGERVVDRAVAVAEAVSEGVVLVVPDDHVDAERVAMAARPGDIRRLVVAGGASRVESVGAGLAAVPTGVDVVCVHDAARPFATADLFDAVIAAVAAGADGAIPGVPVTDTIKVVDDHRRVVATPERDSLVAVQTPQAFRLDVLRRAHDRGRTDATDDAMLLEEIGARVVVVPGEVDNRKITVAADLDWARQRRSDDR